MYPYPRIGERRHVVAELARRNAPANEQLCGMIVRVRPSLDLGVGTVRSRMATGQPAPAMFKPR
jgi:hypothetical protein